MKEYVFYSLIVLICFLSSTALYTYAEETEALQPESATQQSYTYTNYRDCIRLYKLPFDKVYELALASVNFNKYEIEEMQSRNGYIIFSAEGKEFLINAMRKDNNYTFLKIAPCDNHYHFSQLIPQKIFRYVDLHFNTEIKPIKF